jgi:hypothetical protein
LIEIVKLSPAEWNEISEDTMRFSFSEKGWDKNLNRVSYAILAQDKETKIPYGFATIIEMDAQSAHIQSGGTFPSTHGLATAGRGFLKIIEFLRHRYFSVQMNVRNTNTSMLKLALKAGFVTKGILQDKIGDVYLVQDLAETYG